jgi:hypothetical protein
VRREARARGPGDEAPAERHRRSISAGWQAGAGGGVSHSMHVASPMHMHAHNACAPPHHVGVPPALRSPAPQEEGGGLRTSTVRCVRCAAWERAAAACTHARHAQVAAHTHIAVPSICVLCPTHTNAPSPALLQEPLRRIQAVQLRRLPHRALLQQVGLHCCCCCNAAAACFPVSCVLCAVGAPGLPRPKQQHNAHQWPRSRVARYVIRFGPYHRILRDTVRITRIRSGYGQATGAQKK